MGKPITIDIPHQLGAPEARRRIDHGFAKLAEGIAGPGVGQLTRMWDGDQMSFSLGALGQSIRGRLLVMNDVVRVQLELPPLLGALAEAIKSRVQRQGQALLEKK